MGLTRSITILGVFTMLSLGCDDGAQGLIDSVEPDGMGPLNPDDSDDPTSDMGADWQADGDVGPDSPPGDDRDADGDALDEDDGGENEDDDDQGDMGLPDMMLPDYQLPDDVVVGDLGVGRPGEPDEEGEPVQGEVDPTALPVPRCGTFGPADVLREGPGISTSFLHASPGVLFDEPALAGCHPDRLRDESEGRVLQEMFFHYAWDRLVGWLWQINTLDGLGYRLTGRLVHGGDARVIWAAYSCVGAVDPEVYEFRYRGDQLIEVELDRPEGCHALAAGDPTSVRYTYGRHPRWPISRQAVHADGRIDEALLRYTTDDAGRVVAIEEHDALGLPLLERHFEYDADGRVVEETRSRPGEPLMHTRYSYDAEGRLVRRLVGEDDMLEIGYDAEGGIEYVLASNPEYVVRELRFPARGLLEPIGMDAEPVPADDGWRR